MSELLLANSELIMFTPDLMSWVIECLLVAEHDLTQAMHSDITMADRI